MKKHLVFIVSEYLPFPSANGVCISNVIAELSKKNDLSITIICLKSEKKQKAFEIIDNIKVQRIETFERKIRNDIKSSNIKSNKKIFYMNIVRIYKYLKDILHLTTYDRSLKKVLVEKIIEVNKQDNIDYIFPVCFPFESVIASKEVNEKFEIPYTPILFDKYSVSNTLHRNKLNRKLKFKRNLSFEIENIRYSNKVIASYDWKKHIIANWNFNDDFTLYGYPPTLLKSTKNLYQKEIFTGKFIFAGSVNKNIRPVKFIIDFFSQLLHKNAEYHVDFYTQGNEKEKLDFLSKSFPNQVMSNSTVSKDEISSLMKNSDVLISIGNTDTSQTPSKVFEYIGLNQPIIHFYHSIEDPVLNILNQYDKGLSISQDYKKMEYSMKQFDNFINKVKMNSFKNNTEASLYEATPHYYASIIRDLIFSV
ncbi:hypothetical protein [Enterococcus sp. AZ140]|uniref:hypothetical protein n=1 Tax=Enterococcus sp. AZ140 TaxID=2774731 RepID=UPI003F276260